MDSRDQFDELRQRLMKAIAVEVTLGYGHKSYEGSWEITETYPSYFEDPAGNAPPETVMIQLHCYVIGPHRHYQWLGKNFDEAFEKCKADVEKWLVGWEVEANVQ